MKQRRLIVGAVGALAALALTLTACSGDPAAPTGGDQSAPASGGAQNWTIAVVVKDSTNPWFVRMEEGVKKYQAEHPELTVFQKGPGATDATQQAQVIQDLIAQNVNAIAVDPVDPGALETVLQQARDAGIVVIDHEGASQDSAQYDLEAFNNAAYGAFIMDNLAKAMGEEGTYTTMVGNVTNASHNEWADAGVARAKEAYPKMKLLDAQPRVESQDNGETAYEVAKQLLKTYPDLKGIMGTSSFDAPGVARAIDELGLKGKVFTSGTGMPQANKAILENGTVTALTLWDPADAGYAMCELSRKVLAGESLDAPVDLGIPGYDKMQYNKDNPKVLEGAAQIVITKDNVDDYNF